MHSVQIKDLPLFSLLTSVSTVRVHPNGLSAEETTALSTQKTALKGAKGQRNTRGERRETK